MQLNTVIFDMDGLLIDSEPLWNEAANEIFTQYQIQLTPKQHAITMGMRTKEFVEWWFGHYNVSLSHASKASNDILQTVIQKILAKENQCPGLSIFLIFL